MDVAGASQEPGDPGFWEQRYRERLTGWDRGGASPALRWWLTSDAAPACGARVLVPGCGYGHEVLALAQSGYRVTAVDFAPAAVTGVRRRLADAGATDVDVIQADVFEWQPQEPFDAIYEQTCLCALPPERWCAYADRLATWIVPGGCLFALFMQTGRSGGPPFDCKLAAMRSLLSRRLWEWREPVVRVPHPAGFEELGYVLRRRAARG